MKLLLFGGTFDPPHNGHVHLLQNAIAAVRPDRVVVMPAQRRPGGGWRCAAAFCRCMRTLW